MKSLRREGKFRKDIKRIESRNYDTAKFAQILMWLSTGESLPRSFFPHTLKGVWLGYWECHIENDWLLIYKITETEVILARTGTHGDLFNN